MTADVIALRAHLVAEVERARLDAHVQQRDGARMSARSRASVGAFKDRHVADGQEMDANIYACARTATDAWLAADARLRALDGLIARCDALTSELDDVYDQACGGCFAIPAGRAEWRCK